MNKEQELKLESMKHIGKVLKAQRLKKDMSIMELSFKARVNRSTISGIERGKSAGTPIVLSKIAAALEFNNFRDLYIEYDQTVYPKIKSLLEDPPE